MKKYNPAFAIVLFTFLFFNSTIHGQEVMQTYPETMQSLPVKLIKSPKKIKIQDAHVQLGFILQPNAPSSLSDFKKLAPNSTLLNENFSNFNHSNSMGVDGSSMFNVMVGLNFLDKAKQTYKSNVQLRLGINYMAIQGLANSYFKETRKAYDTLISQQTGQYTILDSITYQSYRMNYNSKQLRLDGSLIFKTNTEARWGLYGGIGVSFGASINASTDIVYSKYTRAENPTGINYSSNNSNSNDVNKSEVYIQKNNIGASVYIPLGIDFRIGKKKEFWKHTHLHYELRPGITYLSVPELRTYTNNYLQQGLGIRYIWN
jgi:hypothetical protein